MITFAQGFRNIFQILYTNILDKLKTYLKSDESSRFSAVSSLAVQPAHGHAGHLHCLLQGLAPEILHGSHLSFFLQSLMASMMVILHPAVVPLHVQQVIDVGRGVQLPLHLPHPGQLLMESLPLLFRQSCARTDTAEGEWLGTGCKEEIASPS